MLIKICGLRDNFSDVAALNPDFAGLIFYPRREVETETRRS